jgi:hypothetical protein
MTPPHDDSVRLPSSTAEAWVAHVALLDAYERAVDAGEDGSRHGEALEQIEAGCALDRAGRVLLCEALVEYLADAPLRDRAVGRTLLRRTREHGTSTSQHV